MKKNKKTKKEFTVNKKAFTLVELLVAMFIFVLIISSSSVVFGSIFKTYGDTKHSKDDLENAQYAINLMSKILRTSTVISGNNSSVTVFDYSQSQCVSFSYSGSQILMNTSSANEASECHTMSGGSSITSGNVSGSFSVTESSEGNTVGKIKIVVILETDNKKTAIQTTVSLRDYKEAGINAWNL